MSPRVACTASQLSHSSQGEEWPGPLSKESSNEHRRHQRVDRSALARQEVLDALQEAADDYRHYTPVRTLGTLFQCTECEEAALPGATHCQSCGCAQLQVEKSLCNSAATRHDAPTGVTVFSDGSIVLSWLRGGLQVFSEQGNLMRTIAVRGDLRAVVAHSDSLFVAVWDGPRNVPYGIRGGVASLDAVSSRIDRLSITGELVGSVHVRGAPTRICASKSTIFVVHAATNNQPQRHHNNVLRLSHALTDPRSICLERERRSGGWSDARVSDVSFYSDKEDEAVGEVFVLTWSQIQVFSATSLHHLRSFSPWQQTPTDFFSEDFSLYHPDTEDLAMESCMHIVPSSFCSPPQLLVSSRADGFFRSKAVLCRDSFPESLQKMIPEQDRRLLSSLPLVHVMSLDGAISRIDGRYCCNVGAISRPVGISSRYSTGKVYMAVKPADLYHGCYPCRASDAAPGEPLATPLLVCHNLTGVVSFHCPVH